MRSIIGFAFVVLSHVWFVHVRTALMHKHVDVCCVLGKHYHTSLITLVSYYVCTVRSDDVALASAEVITT